MLVGEQRKLLVMRLNHTIFFSVVNTYTIDRFKFCIFSTDFISVFSSLFILIDAYYSKQTTAAAVFC